MISSATVPNYPTDRLIGVELEIDVRQRGDRNSIPTVSGWTRKPDGSLQNGWELVMEPPRSLPSSLSYIRNLCEKLVNINVHKSGGLHVHVQAEDYTHDDCFRLVQLYTYFQRSINNLVGQSRVNNSFCPPYRRNITKRELVEMFDLNHPASNRAMAKGAREYSVVNLAMMRCRTASQRTVEFRQGSVSKRFVCVAGWATLMTALVDIAKDQALFNEWVTTKPQNFTPPQLFKNFIDMLKAHETKINVHGLAAWVEWRNEYLNGRPTMDQLRKLCNFLMGGHKGLFTISRQFDTNLTRTKAMIALAVEKRLIQKHSSKELWTVAYETIAPDDLQRLERYARAEGQLMMSELENELESAVNNVLNSAPLPPVPASQNS